MVHNEPPTCFGPLPRNFQLHNEQHKNSDFCTCQQIS